MSYKQAMETAGAKVLEYEQFGSYQGDWIAVVEYEGSIKFIKGFYGSCSGCDSFESEFGYIRNHEHNDNPYFNPQYETPLDACAECQKYLKDLADFGKGYLKDNVYHYQGILDSVSRNLEWDLEAQDMVDFVSKCQENIQNNAY